jgi:hypothetical protein
MLSRPRRYHWLSESLQSFVDEPHAAIGGIEQGVISTSPIGTRRNRAIRCAIYTRKSSEEGLEPIACDDVEAAIRR